jgi:hypothetical protein
MQPIYQLLQWLVKKLLESRDERNAVNKRIAKEYYNINFGEHQVKSNKSNTNFETTYLHTKYNYINTGRQFRRAQDTSLEYNDPLRVYYTLVEYGMNKDLSFQRTMIDLLKKKNIIEGERRDSQDKGVIVTNDEINKLDEVLQTNVKEVKGSKLNTNIIEEIFSENVDAIIKEIDK